MKVELGAALSALLMIGASGWVVMGCGSDGGDASPEEQPGPAGGAGGTGSGSAASSGGLGASSASGTSGGAGGNGGSSGGVGGDSASSGGSGGDASSSVGSTGGASSSGSGGSGGDSSSSSGGDPSSSASSTGSGDVGGDGPDFGLYGYGRNATGGKGGAVVSVSSLDALRAEAKKPGALIIRITGKISGSGDDVDVASDKTIVGVGSSGELQGIGLNLRRSSNIILRNLKIHHVLASSGNGDAIHLDGTHDVWIDHCELWAESPAVNSDKDKYDGLIDITHESSDITVSWSYLHDHWKGMLIGSSDKDDSDRRVTFHHNYFRNVNSRVPSYRGGKGHVYNNYYEDVPTSGVNSRVGACLRVEGNHFLRVKNPVTTLDSPAGGTDLRDNLFEQVTGTQMSGATCVWDAPYDYPLDAASRVKALVTEHAGVGKIDPLEGLP